MRTSTRLAQLLLAGCTFLHRISSRSPTLEKMTGCRLSPTEAVRLTAICHASGQSIGRYYHWKIEQWLMICILRNLRPAHLRTFISAHDRSDYTLLDAQLRDERSGLLIAVPHHGHFPASIIAAIERISAQRRVSVFYDPPAKQASNAIFDGLHDLLYTQDSPVSVIHNTRKGLIQAVRELRTGQAVIIMPDVFANVEDTWVVPFLSRYRAVSLGTASIARMTGASVLTLGFVSRAEFLRF